MVAGDDGSPAFTLELKGLNQILKALKAEPPQARVGILGSKAVRPGSKGPSNAEIGAAHEFGTTKHPIRSFLRGPISDNLNKDLEAQGAFSKKEIADVIQSGSVVSWLKKIVIVAEGIVAGAFDSGGYGKWHPSNMAHKKNHQTLVETQQLRNSITSEVKE